MGIPASRDGKMQGRVVPWSQSKDEETGIGDKGDRATGIPSWDWDFKDVYDDELGTRHVDAVFAAVGRVRSDYRDPLAKFLVHKKLAQEGKLYLGEYESLPRSLACFANAIRANEGLEAWPADKSPSEGYLTAVVDGRTARFGADVMNSCATTLNVAMRLLWPERFPSTSARSLLRAFEEGGMCWPQAEGPRVVLWEKLERFAALTHTVGNFAIIPWREGNALNKAKNRTLQDCLAGVGSPRDYEDLFLMRLQSTERESGNAWWHWTEFCPVSFGCYVALANLEFYCVDDAAVRAFLEAAGNGVRDDALHAYADLRERARVERQEDGRCRVRPFWPGHSCSEPLPNSLDQVESFLDAVNLRIEARGRLLCALDSCQQGQPS